MLHLFFHELCLRWNSCSLRPPTCSSLMLPTYLSKQIFTAHSRDSTTLQSWCHDSLSHGRWSDCILRSVNPRSRTVRTVPRHVAVRDPRFRSLSVPMDFPPSRHPYLHPRRGLFHPSSAHPVFTFFLISYQVTIIPRCIITTWLRYEKIQQCLVTTYSLKKKVCILSSLKIAQVLHNSR